MSTLLSSRVTAVVVWTLTVCSAIVAQDLPGNPQRPAARARANASEDPQIEAARRTYDAAQWPRGTRRNGFDLSALQPPDLVGENLELRVGSQSVARRYLDAAGTPRVLVELSVFDRIGAAHQALLRHLAYVQTPRPLPTAASLGIGAGDVGYVGVAGVQQERISWIAFVHGNLELRVSNLDLLAESQPDLRGVVERLDAAIQATEAAGERGSVPRPVFERVAAAFERGKVEQPLALEIAAHDSTGGAVRLEFEVLKGQGEVIPEDGAQGSPANHRFTVLPGSAGPLEIRIHALGKHGTFADATLKLQIDPAR